MALSAAHAPLLPLSEERPDPVGCSLEPASLAWTVGKPWVRTRVHLGLGREGGGVGRNGCHVPGNAQLSLAASPASRPGQILPIWVSLGQTMCARAMVVLGLLWGGAGGWLFWRTAQSLALCVSGDALTGCGEQPCAGSGLTPCSAMTAPGRHKCAPWEQFSPSQCTFPIGCSKISNTAQPGLSMILLISPLPLTAKIFLEEHPTLFHEHVSNNANYEHGCRSHNISLHPTGPSNWVSKP